MRRRLMTVVVAALAVMMVAGTAAAAETGASTDSGTTLQGRGKLVARGVGSVDLDGRGTVKLKIVGDVSIVDRSGSAVVWVRRWNPETQSLDERTRLEAVESIYLFNDFRGVIWVRGSDFSLDANGKVRKLKAVGEGTVRLIGHGWWKTRHAEGRWGHGIRYAAGTTELSS